MMRRRRFAVWCLLTLGLITGVQLALMFLAARKGADDLAFVESSLKNRSILAVDGRLQGATQNFSIAEEMLGSPNPLFVLARITPYIKDQVGGVRALFLAGGEVSRAGRDLLPSLSLLAPGIDGGSRAALLDQLPTQRPALEAGVHHLQKALSLLASPVDLESSLSRVRRRTEDHVYTLVERGMQARAGVLTLNQLLGGHATNYFLLLSQNPEEPRPGGGYIGTYGLLAGSAGHLELSQYAAISAWDPPNHIRGLPATSAAVPLRLATPPEGQGLDNVNTTPDWPTSARLAKDIWEGGGDDKISGVVTYRMDALTKLLGATGPVRVPGYPDLVSEQNAKGLIEFYTHRKAVRDQDPVKRKDFIGRLAKVIFSDTLSAAVPRQGAVVRALLSAAAEGDIQVWCPDSETEAALAATHWDGALPQTNGDFFADSTFAYATKNGSFIHRQFTHEVSISPDGSGLSLTRALITDTGQFDPDYNAGSSSYIRPFGPVGGILAPPSDHPVAYEPVLARHPSAGWFRDAAPGHSTSLTVAWLVPDLLEPVASHHWRYRLSFLPDQGHLNDSLLIHVTLPAGWRWDGPAPPTSVSLDRAFEGVWNVVAPS